MTINEFIDFAAATRPKLAGSVDKLQNEASKYRTYLFRRITAGLSDKLVFQSGSSIDDYIQLAITSTYQEYQPTDTFTYSGSNSLTKITVPWRFSKVHSVITDHELELNNGGDEKTIFKRLRDVKNQEMMTAQFEGFEDSLWAAPDSASMEATTGLAARSPYSLRCFVTTDGGAPTAANSGATGSWTTVMTVNPSTFTNWKNQYEQYTAANINDELLPKMDAMWLDVQYESPDTSQKYFEDTRLNKMTILCSKPGYLKMVALAAERNDNLGPRYNLRSELGKVQFNGIPLTYIGALDTVDATPDLTNKFLYRWFNFNYIRPIFHSKRFMFPIDPPITAAQPTSHVMIRDTWRNMWCTSRRQQGVVFGA